MPDLNFAIEGASILPAETPSVAFRLRITESASEPTPIRSIQLRCQARIQPARRRYTPAEQERLLPLFGTPERWGQTVHDLLWATASVTVPSFLGETTVELPVPCDHDPNHAATRYFDGLDDGDAAIIFLFNGTVFYDADGVGPQVSLISWDREARCRFPVSLWKELFAQAVKP
jgi:hypothetical protein